MKHSGPACEPVAVLGFSLSAMSQLAPHVLVVDDDPAILAMLSEYLRENDLCVTLASTGAEMQAALETESIELVLLDLRLKGEDGMQLARSLRETRQIPVIIVTGKRDEADRVMGLELAADDYVNKPFSPRELLARIRAVLRRYKALAELRAPQGEQHLRAYRFDGWELNLRSRRLTAPDGRKVDISNGEFNLLQALCAAPRRVLSRDQLLDLSRLHGAEVYDRSIDVQILRLRRRIEQDPSQPRYICTERGAGYIFDVAVDVVA